MKRTALVVTLAVTLVACGSDTPPPTVDIGDVGRDVLPTPDYFSSVAFICNGPVGVYVTTDDVRSSSGVAVLANDPNCEER